MSLLITSPFGWRMLHGQREFHPGIDLGLPEGTPVVAARPGEVTEVDTVGVGPGQSEGNAVHIRDPWGYSWVYMHLSNVKVAPGQKVDQRQLVGHVGHTGWATGPHLHLQVRSPAGQLLDPERFYPRGSFRQR